MYVQTYGEVYRPLGEKQIRLIRLQPGAFGQPLICSLDAIELDNPPSYEALSYVWGSEEKGETAQVNKQDIHITENLHVALNYLRSESEIITLWVDALCICQDETSDKSSQVRMMGDIFRKATRTWIWLGEASDEDEAVVDYLCNASSPTDIKPKDLPMPALQHFFGRPWFRRLWILQEALLSRQPVAQCGNKTADFTRIVKLSTDLIFDNLGNNRGDAFAQCKLRRCLHEWDALKRVLAGGGWPLLHAMPMTETLECTKFEDRVYALLGLATDADRKFVQVDYSRPFEEIQTELCAYLICSPENPLHALHYMGAASAKGGGVMPSWTRDWTAPKTEQWRLVRKAANVPAQERWHMLYTTPATLGYEWLNAEAERVPWTMEPTALGSDVVRFSADLRTLALKGIVVDEVQSAHPAPLQGDEAAWKSTCEEWKEIALERMKAYASPQERFEAFCKTLCRGDYRDRDGVLRATCGDAYRTWISGQDHSSSNGPRDDFGFRVKVVGMERTLVITKRGYAAIAPGDTKEGDLICFFKGNLDPFVLRRREDTFIFIGDTFVPDLMNGEWIQEAKGTDVKEFRIQ